MAAVAGAMAVTAFSASYLGRICHPTGRYLLIGYSVFLLIGFPVGTLQGIFQIIHLTRPEAKLIFENGDRLSSAESQQVTAFRNANPWLAGWLRLGNFLGILALLGVFAAVAIPALMR